MSNVHIELQRVQTWLFAVPRLRAMVGTHDGGAKQALIPIESKRNFLDVSANIMEHVDPVFYGDPKTAAMKVLGG